LSGGDENPGGEEECRELGGKDVEILGFCCYEAVKELPAAALYSD
jgi:hypothetical protein